MSNRSGRLEESERRDEQTILPVCDLLPKGAARAGDRCPRCKLGVLDYDGTLNLACPECRYTEGGCFT